MEYDDSWNALLRPGESADFFCHAEQTGPFHPETGDYSVSNAWWLCELSRLIYRRGEDEAGICANPTSRKEILKEAGLKEIVFVSTQGISHALVSDEEESFAIVVFRGTSRFEHWFSNLNTVQTQWADSGLVHSGFKNEFEKIQSEFREMISVIHVPLFYTGHSLGGALATLAASVKAPRAVYTFGSPRVGDSAFRNSLASVNLYRIAMESDIVTTLPPSGPLFDFCHAGEAKILSFQYHNEIFQENSALNLSELISAAFMKRFIRPPDFLSAHSPINYSIGLLRELVPRKDNPSEYDG